MGWEIPPGNPLFAWFNAGMTILFLYIFHCKFQKLYKHAKFDQNIWCGLRVMSIFTNYYWTDGRIDSHSYYSADPSVVQVITLMHISLLFQCLTSNILQCTKLNYMLVQ